MTLSPTEASLYPKVAFPEDAGLPDLPKLFDEGWVRKAYRGLPRQGEVEPSRFRIRQFAHRPGGMAIISYEVEWDPEEYIPSELIAARIEKGRPAEVFHYTDDPYLPGLRKAAYPESALELVNKRLLSMRVRRTGVELVRYRPTARAVLRHSAGKVRFYARVVRPDALAPLLEAHELISRSGFVVPRLAGRWDEGGVVWLSEIPGKNLRRNMRRGKIPETERLLKGLESLWRTPMEGSVGRPFNLRGTYQRARRIFRHNIPEDCPARLLLEEASRSLDPFIESWRPTSIAHNDFYDDQMLVLPDGRIALVDFEESGPGDPMLDVGNFLGHLRWRARLGRERKEDASDAYYREFRRAALDRFGWGERDLAFRESVCLFRICTNTIRHPQPDWLERLESGLRLVNETLG